MIQLALDSDTDNVLSSACEKLLGGEEVSFGHLLAKAILK
jgi:hypothetical protein